ncbi:DUF4037 domain-containing protein [Streptomyces sp. PR69]|uniref:DUF4037 domain-containing protein n=1 Tax=Streptomyces sp. PR69 TaxID=2984950 RepID=UPI0022649F87|nr:DUF4037 domain-containing protein [Streptomyces sp. PR69]
MRGRELSRSFYEHLVAPLVDGIPHSAALLGDGSEVLGFDDDVSTDHDFGPRLTLFLPQRADPDLVHEALAALPETFNGYPVERRRVEVVTASAYFTERIGVDPADGMGLADWLLAPTQRLAALVEGPVFQDRAQLLQDRRAALRWYPPDVWRYVLAAGWLRIAQEETFVGRTGMLGDALGSTVASARAARDLMRLAFLVERRWAPYGKWLGTAFARLPVAPRVAPHLHAALHARAWRAREAALNAAAGALAAATNRLGLAAEVDPAPRQFHARDIQVLDAARLTNALVARITDPEVRALVDRLGPRHDGTAGRLPGAIDQAVDCAEILMHPPSCRALAPALGL